MRNRIVSTLALLASLATWGALGAAEPNDQKARDLDGSPSIEKVTDGRGNQVPLQRGVATRLRDQDGTAPVAPTSDTPPPVLRGQGWWPYSISLTPYTPVDKRAEAMTADEIQVNGVAILDTRDPEGSLAQVPKDLLLKRDSQLVDADGYYLVKIAGFSRTQVHVDAVEAAGAVLGEFMNVNTYVAKIPTASVGAVRALPFVTYVGDYHPAYKISPRLGQEEIPYAEAYDIVTGQPRPWLLEVTLHKGADVRDVQAELTRLGVFTTAADIVGNESQTVLLVRTDPSAIPAIAKVPGVKWIAEKLFAQLLASATNPAAIPMLLQNNGAYTTNTATGWKLWNNQIDGNRSGTAQVVTIMDTGLNTKMEHFSQDVASHGTIGAAHRKVVGYDVFGGDQCVNNFATADGGHGTWTSQHALGSISNMTGSPDVTHVPNGNWDVGIARDAKVYFQDIGAPAGGISPPADLGASITSAIAKGSFIQNHSWGSPSPTYDSQASLLDTAMFNNPSMVVTVSAGNRGTSVGANVGSPSTAKNVICVGGADAANPNNVFQDCSWDGVAACGGTNDLGSSRGPVTTSNRVKPDIVAYMAFSALVGGENEAGNRPSAMCQTDGTKTVYWDFTNNNGFGGTSFSAPEVAGLAAVVRDYFVSGFYPTGTATPGNTVSPSGALVKAMILASGEDMTTTSSPSAITMAKRYGNDVGYGRANLPSVFHVGSGAPFLWVQNSDTLGDGATKTFFYNINGNTLPLRVMMVYYDAAGNALQKDADLKVTIGANVYWGNNFSAGWSTTATSTRDHTNNTEGVFLDAAHGLPASGTVRVDVIGFSNPGGMPYSLVVVGDVASQNVTQVSLNKGSYTCAETVAITVNDSAGSSPVNVTVNSYTGPNGTGSLIDTEVVSCTGAGGVFTGSVVTGSGITVADGGSIVATYSGSFTATAAIDCTGTFADGGFIIEGGCDNSAAGTDDVSGPLSSGGQNEFYNKYMDGGEYNAYTFGFVNQTGAALTDVYVTLSFSGAGASKMTVLNNPVHVGGMPADGLSGAVFQVFTDPTVVGLTGVNMDFDITSPADGWTTATRVTQTRLLMANDQILRQQQCSPFNTALTPWFESVGTASAILNPWRWSGSATAPATVGSELRVDGACGSATANAAAMTGNSGTATAPTNFAANADSFLLQNFQPALRGNGPNGQPYHYVWKWHSFYHASEALANQGGAWGVFYNNEWNSAVNPTGTQATAFPINLSYFFHTIFDYVGTWNWDAANGGTPDDPRLGPSTGGAPNQLFITFANDVTGLATNSTWFSYGHEHLDDTFFGGAVANRDIALDNDRLVYDEYYTLAQGAACTPGTQVGQIAFDRFQYDDCPSSTVVLSVTDANAVGPFQVTVTSPGTGDSESVTMTGSAPFFSGTLTIATNAGHGVNNGTLFVLPDEEISATYTDLSPAGSSTATANVGCDGGNVAYLANTQVSDNGDNDAVADNKETVTLDITIKNNTALSLTNTKVEIYSDTPATIDCIPDNQALYGTVAPGASQTNPSGDRFQFHVAPAVQCADATNPPVGRFTVVITADNLDGSSVHQQFDVQLDLDATGGAFTYSQNFNVDPGWTTGATADDDGTAGCGPYVNEFHYCALCGNAGAGYGAWTGNAAFGGTQNYQSLNSSTLYSPTFIANGALTLTFQVAYRTETGWDGANVQYKLGLGNWTTLGFTTPAQTAITNASCNPLLLNEASWNGNGVSWTTTNAAAVPASSGQNVQFRWRLGADETVNGTTFGGYGVDNVSITGLKQFVCEPTRNTGLAACVGGCPTPTGLTNNSAADVNLCADSGVQVAWSQDVGSWGDVSGTRTYDVLRNGSPIATGIAYGTTTYTDTTGVNGTTYTYSVRYNNGCGSSATTSGATASDNATVCTASDQCHVAGVCDTGTGLCSNPSAADNTPCSDANACTQSDTCQSGVCTGSNPVVCSAIDQCHVAGTCNPGTGLCSNPDAANGTGCNDGNGCTQTDTCQSGLCSGSNPVVCNASDQCHVAGTCSPGTGLCSNPNAANNTPCNDANACTQSDTCQAGACTGSNPVVCNASDQCHVAGTCDTGTGLCSDPAAPDATPCSDGNVCTSGDACLSGACNPGAPVPPPAEVDGGVRVNKNGGGGSDVTWNAALNATSSDVLRGDLGGLPVGPGGGDESCIGDNVGGTLLNDGIDPITGGGFYYLVRGGSACGTGPYGFQGVNGAAGAARVSTTCP